MFVWNGADRVERLVAWVVCDPEYSFYDKYRQIGEYNGYRWKPPPGLRNEEAIRANFAARMALSSFCSRG